MQAIWIDEVISATGLIDSAGLLELIAWFEAEYAFSIPAVVDHPTTLERSLRWPVICCAERACAEDRRIMLCAGN